MAAAAAILLLGRLGMRRASAVLAAMKAGLYLAPGSPWHRVNPRPASLINMSEQLCGVGD